MKQSPSYLAIILSALLAASGVRGADRAGQEPTIQLFLQICAVSYAHAELVEKTIRDFRFTELDGEIARPYLGDGQGRVWAGTFQSKRFAVALRPEVLCTVIAHDGRSAEIKAAVESWLPPPSSGISVRTSIDPVSDSLETTMYELRGGNVRERWVVSTSRDPDSDVRAMLSWSRQ